MAKAEKYRFQFRTLEGQLCTVRFYFEGWTGASTTLTGADKPFTLQEFNTDENLFKPTRPQLATINIVSDSSGVKIEDFLMDNDDDVIVYFDFGPWGNYWVGYLQQDDFQEAWVDTNHIITLRASEGIGLLQNKTFTYFGSEANSKYTFLQGLEAAMDGTIHTFAEYYVFSSLYHSQMTSYGAATTGLDQAYFDGRTFESNPNEYTDSLTVVDAINTAWSQTIFQYKGAWNVLRIEDLFIPPDQNIRGYAQTLIGRTAINQRYDALVGVDESVKPISPEMLRYIRRRTKYDKVKFEFEDLAEIVPNGTFAAGSFISESSTLKQYNVSDWTFQEGGTTYPSFASPSTPSTGSVVRYEEWTDTTTGVLTDNYLRFPPSGSVFRWIKSQAVPVVVGEKMTFSVEVRFQNQFTEDGQRPVAYILLAGASNNFLLQDDGKWFQTNASWSNFENLSISYNNAGDPDEQEWNSVSVESEAFPQAGNVYVVLISDYRTNNSGQFIEFRNLDFSIISQFNSLMDAPLKSIESKFEKSDTLKNATDNQILFNDGFSKSYKGSIYRQDQNTLTDKGWYRYRYSSERYGFQRQNNTAYWFNNRYNRNKLDVAFYGLTWDEGNQPIGLINTIKFVDDDPDKVYYILNLKEIDFAASTWSATLIEIWDEEKDGGDNETFTFQGNVEAGTHSGITYLPLEITTGSQFVIQNTDELKYTGAASFTTDITCLVEGDFTGISVLPHNATLTLKKNGSTLSSQSLNVTAVPTSFNFDLSVNNVTFNTNDIIQIQLSNRITDIDIVSSDINFTYTTSGALTYDPYTEKYLYE